MSIELTGGQVQELAARAGFDLAGVTDCGAPEHADAYRSFVASGYHGTMSYLARYMDVRCDPQRILPDARSIICLGVSYHTSEAVETVTAARDQLSSTDHAINDTPSGQTGHIARYAWGRDYHRVLKKRMHHLVALLSQAAGRVLSTRVCVDTAPVLERDLAMRAGLGWIGKNGCLIHPKWGSYVYLCEIFSDLRLETGTLMADHCGQCRRCVDACPTGAIRRPYVVDARRCISYLTIEHRGCDVPAEAACGLAGYVYGCDICQQVCPHNRKSRVTDDADWQVRYPAPSVPIRDVLQWTHEDWDTATRGRALRRATLDMWQRNARVAEDVHG